MDVEAAMLGRVEHCLGKDQPIGRDDSDIGLQVRETRLLLGGFQRGRVAHLDPQILRAALNRRRR